MKISKKWIRICNITCSVLLLALLVLQWLPFWSMPTCEICQLRCELETNEDCAACKINPGWCVVPTSCICEYKCVGRNINRECPVCSVDKSCCATLNPAPNETAAATTADSTEGTADETTAATTEATVETTEATVEATVDATDATVEATVEATEAKEEEKKPLPLVPTGPIPEVREPVKIAIQEYVWMPTFERCDGVFDYFDGIYSIDNPGKDNDYEFMLKDIVLMPVIVFFFSLVGGFLGIYKSDKSWVSIFALVTGIAAIIGYLTQPIFQTGALWQVHLGVGIAIFLVSLVPTADYILRAIRWLNPKQG